VSGIFRSFLFAVVFVLLLVTRGGGRVSESFLTRGWIFHSINAGESHAYNLPLGAGEFVELSLRQHEIDVSFTLRSPGDKDPLRIYLPPWGRRTAAITSLGGGEYKLIVSAAPDGSRSGNYGVEIVQRRISTAHDETRIAGQTASSEGTMGFRRPSRTQQDNAIDTFRKAVRLSHSAGDRSQEAESLYWLGRALSRAAQYEEARSRLLDAAQIFREHGHDELALLTTYDALGPVYGHIGEKWDGLPFHVRAYELWKRAHDRRGQSDMLGKIGSLQLSKGNAQGALAAFQEALSLRRALGDRQAEAAALEDIGKLYQVQGDFGRAVEINQRGLALREVIGDRRGEASAIFQIGISLERMGRSAEALTFLERSRSLRHAMGDISAEAGVLQDIANVQRDLKNFIESAAALREAVALERRVQSGVSDPKWRAGIQATRNYESNLITSLMDLNTRDATGAYGIEAFLVADRAHAGFFLTSPTDTRSPNLAELQRRLLDENTMLLEYWIEPGSGWLWSVTKQAFSVHRLSSEPQIESLAVHLRNALTARDQAIDGESAPEKEVRFARADAESARLSQSLSEALLEPVKEMLGKKRIVIVSHGALQYLPFAILPDPHRQDHAPMIIDHEIVNWPSATMVALREPLGRTNRDSMHSLAILADPVFTAMDPRVPGHHIEPVPERVAQITRAAGFSSEKGLPRLLFSRREQIRLVSIAPPGSVLALRDFDATRQVALSGRLSEYRIWHFASHAVFNDDPEFSGVILSLVDREGRPLDGLLRLRDLLELSVPAELVVLSACQTSLGHDYRAAGNIGITSGFLRAGARQVLSTTWSMDDEVMNEFMSTFYEVMLGPSKLRPAAALGVAQRAVRAQPRWHSPYYWGGFVLHGQND
jgi:CHAT domain-containing protein/tetratricopeptide (TPR) repeat protein